MSDGTKHLVRRELFICGAITLMLLTLFVATYIGLRIAASALRTPSSLGGGGAIVQIEALTSGPDPHLSRQAYTNAFGEDGSALPPGRIYAQVDLEWVGPFDLIPVREVTVRSGIVTTGLQPKVAEFLMDDVARAVGESLHERNESEIAVTMRLGREAFREAIVTGAPSTSRAVVWNWLLYQLIPIVVPFVLVIALGGFYIRNARRYVRRSLARCGNCGYSAASTGPGSICSECGAALPHIS